MDITKTHVGCFVLLVGILLCAFHHVARAPCPVDSIDDVDDITIQSVGDNTISGTRSNLKGVKRIDIAMTTNGTGIAEEDLTINGEILKIYIVNGSFNDSATINVSDTLTNELILSLYNFTATALYYPRQIGTNYDATTLNASSNQYSPFFANKILVHVSGAGNTTSGNISIFFR